MCEKDIQIECDKWLSTLLNGAHPAYLQEFMVTPLENLGMYKDSICDRMCSENSLWKYGIKDTDAFTMNTLVKFWKNTEV